jgi:uncharacterized protein YuzE
LINSSTTPDFWKCFQALPKEIQTQAKKKYFLWKKNPRHPSVRFKKVGTLWSVRIDENYRVRSLKEGVIIDYGNDGKIVSIEILDASEQISESQGIFYEIT